MAKFHPDLDTIRSMAVQLMEGELQLLNLLNNHLDDSFEIFYRPFLNGDRPGMVLVRENYGVLIIEISELHFRDFFLDKKRKWHHAENGEQFKSPIEKVLQYKENIFELHVEHLLEKKIKDVRYMQVVACAVYFSNETYASINGFLIEPFKEDEKYISSLKRNIQILGTDTLDIHHLDELLRSKHITSDRQSFLFDRELYESLKRYLKPPIHSREDGKIPFSFYIGKQQEAIISKAEERVIRGVVGSGKTTVLAARAVSAYKRTGARVLILTYNITLKNYIIEKIRRVEDAFSWNGFYINNYHGFINSEMNNQGIPFVMPGDFDKCEESEKSDYLETNYYSNTALFSRCITPIHRYETILIDEVQDYKLAWLNMIKTYFLEPGGEYVLFGDEKQNIYDNELEQKGLKLNIDKRFKTELKGCFRLKDNVRDMALNFQKSLFAGKYEPDEFDGVVLTKSRTEGYMKYFFVPQSKTVMQLFDYITRISKGLNEHPSDIAALGVSIKLLRKLDTYYRYKTNERTNGMFETTEVWYKLFLDIHNKEDSIKQGLAFFQKRKTIERKKAALAKAMTLLALMKEFDEPLFKKHLSEFTEKYKIEEQAFALWYENSGIKGLIAKSNESLLYRAIKVRENKKIHFEYGKGTLKLSTIHSFKGWEANTLFLIIEPTYTALTSSFEELIYTGLTRSKSNLIVLNYGNHDLHSIIEKLFT
jgi:hypothetical protein